MSDTPTDTPTATEPNSLSNSNLQSISSSGVVENSGNVLREVERRNAVETLLSEMTQLVESQKLELHELRTANGDMKRTIEKLQRELTEAKHHNAVLDVAVKDYVVEKLQLSEVENFFEKVFPFFKKNIYIF